MNNSIVHFVMVSIIIHAFGVMSYSAERHIGRSLQITYVRWAITYSPVADEPPTYKDSPQIKTALRETVSSRRAL